MQFFLLKHGESRLIEIKEADKEEEPKENGHAEHCEATEAGEVQAEPEAEEEKKNDADMLQELIANLDDDPQPEAERNEDED